MVKVEQEVPNEFYTTVNHLIRTKMMSPLVIRPKQRVHTTKLLNAKCSSGKSVLMYNV